MFSQDKKQNPFHVNIKDEVLDNDNYRKVLYTVENHFQVVAMSIPPKVNIGFEKHEGAVQSITIYEGIGRAVIYSPEKHEYFLEEGDIIVIPPDCKHNIYNRSGVKALKLVSYYLPPEHPINLVQKFKK